MRPYFSHDTGYVEYKPGNIMIILNYIVHRIVGKRVKYQKNIFDPEL